MAKAKQPQSDILWTVGIRNQKHTYPSTTNLLILASSAEIATRKAQGHIKKELSYDPGYKVVKVECEGTIDVF